MENYFNYFTEIEEQFLRRRGGGLLLTTLDWALIETWKDAGIPLEAALRGIDAAFDRYDQRPSKTKKINSLAYCSQEVLAAAEDMKEAAVGTAAASPAKSGAGQGFEPADNRRIPAPQCGFTGKGEAAPERRNLGAGGRRGIRRNPAQAGPGNREHEIRCSGWMTWSVVSRFWKKSFLPHCWPLQPMKKS